MHASSESTIRGRLPRAWGALPIVLCMAAGCATLEKRIEEKADVFAMCSPEEQAAIRAGRVNIGFSPDMVYIACGRPDRTYTRTTITGDVLVWVYTDRQYHYRTEPVPTGYYAPGPGGRVVWHPTTQWVDIQTPYDVESLRIEFKDGRVTAVETKR